MQEGRRTNRTVRAATSRTLRQMRAFGLIAVIAITALLAALVLISPGHAFAGQHVEATSTEITQNSDSITETVTEVSQNAESDTETPSLTITVAPTNTPVGWQEVTLSELAGSLAWPTAVQVDDGGKLSVSLVLSSTDYAEASIRPFDYSAGAQAAFAAEQQDALLAGLQVSAGEFYSYPSYVATAQQGGVIIERRLHWIAGASIMGVDISGSGTIMQSLNPFSVARQLLTIAIANSLPAPPGWASTPQPTIPILPSPSPTVSPCALSFTDVGNGYWAKDYILQLACSGIVSGYSDGTFRPQAPTTRAQLAKMMVLAEGWPLADPAEPTFLDVDSSHLFFRYVETAYAHGVIGGFDGDLFKPDKYVTRAEVAKMLVLARGWDLTVQTPHQLCDVPTSHWAWLYIQVAIQHGAFSGYPNSCFMPDNYATRAQLAKVVVRGQQ